jgi:hypothetical protein
LGVEVIPILKISPISHIDLNEDGAVVSVEEASVAFIEAPTNAIPPPIVEDVSYFSQ